MRSKLIREVRAFEEISLPFTGKRRYSAEDKQGRGITTPHIPNLATS